MALSRVPGFMASTVTALQSFFAASSAANARAAITAAASGANADITSMTGLTTPLTVTQGGTGASTVLAARVALNIDQATTVADAAVTLTNATEAVVYTSLTAARVVTLASAATMNPGQAVYAIDESGNCSGTNTITLTAAGSDKINGASTYVLNTAFAAVMLIRVSSTKWTAVSMSLPLPLPVAQGGTGATTATAARTALSAAKSGANTDLTSVTLSTGANSSLVIGQDSTTTTRNIVSLNGVTTEAGASGIWGGTSGSTDFNVSAPASGSIYFWIGGSNKAVINGGAVSPVVDNALSSAAAAQRWSVVYSATGTINTSDARQKTAIADLPAGLAFVQALRPVSYKWIVGGKTETVVQTTGPDGAPVVATHYVDRPGARTHWGLLAQDVKTALDAAGYDSGLYVYDQASDSYGLRTEQLIPVLIKAVQELADTVARLQPAAK